MHARGEHVREKIEAARALTVQFGTVFDPAAILKIGIETLKSNSSKLYTPKSCMQKENMFEQILKPLER